MLVFEAGLLVEEDGSIGAVVLGAERRRSGRGGTTNVTSFDEANIISLEDFVCFS